jgi:hypothetical protein
VISLKSYESKRRFSVFSAEEENALKTQLPVEDIEDEGKEFLRTPAGEEHARNVDESPLNSNKFLRFFFLGDKVVQRKVKRFLGPEEVLAKHVPPFQISRELFFRLQMRENRSENRPKETKKTDIFFLKRLFLR